MAREPGGGEGREQTGVPVFEEDRAPNSRNPRHAEAPLGHVSENMGAAQKAQGWPKGCGNNLGTAKVFAFTATLRQYRCMSVQASIRSAGPVRRRGKRFVVLAIMIAAAIWVPNVIYVPFISDAGCCSRFDEAAWKAVWRGEYSGGLLSCVRGHMVNDLTHRLSRTRPTRTDVLALLGPDSRTVAQADSKLVYVLGFCDRFPFSIDADILEIHFDGEGRFSRINRYQS